MPCTLKVCCIWLFFVSAFVRADETDYLSLLSPQYSFRSNQAALNDECFPGGGGATCETFRIETDPRDPEGLRRDTWYFIGYQFVAVGILYLMPESVTGWTDEQKSDYSLDIWWENASNPAWDEDDDYLNYVLHPYWGAAYYVRARERGYGHWGGFWYSVLLSCIFEFGAEAIAEQPSIQDLIVTPVVGTMVGTYFVRVRSDIYDKEMDRGYRSTGEKWVMVLTDPLGAMNRGVDRLFRRDADIHIQPYVRTGFRPHNLDLGQFEPANDNVIGIEFRLRW